MSFAKLYAAEDSCTARRKEVEDGIALEATCTSYRIAHLLKMLALHEPNHPLLIANNYYAECSKLRLQEAATKKSRQDIAFAYVAPNFKTSREAKIDDLYCKIKDDIHPGTNEVLLSKMKGAYSDFSSADIDAARLRFHADDRNAQLICHEIAKHNRELLAEAEVSGKPPLYFLLHLGTVESFERSERNRKILFHLNTIGVSVADFGSQRIKNAVGPQQLHAATFYSDMNNRKYLDYADYWFPSLSFSVSVKSLLLGLEQVNNRMATALEMTTPTACFNIEDIATNELRQDLESSPPTGFFTPTHTPN